MFTEFDYESVLEAIHSGDKPQRSQSIQRLLDDYLSVVKTGKCDPSFPRFSFVNSKHLLTDPTITFKRKSEHHGYQESTCKRFLLKREGDDQWVLVDNQLRIEKTFKTMSDARSCAAHSIADEVIRFIYFSLQHGIRMGKNPVSNMNEASAAGMRMIKRLKLSTRNVSNIVTLSSVVREIQDCC